MKTIKIFGKNREEIEKQARDKYGENYFIISIRELSRKNIFGIIKKEFEVSIGVLEQY
ncbi:hypothetical protein R4M03_04170 [Brachyspira pilosicoli]|uniref:Uncharacterized protein n=5 Tax=Brachyspira pilosicoli TaxID=52584 RepID=D8IA40_BRAP9|nr:hypothetical protein [Brachyspira pilosicoli]ADK32170.1 hypothetical protein BP951000_2197 [Brachyspira pilosicoli 95/1000]AFR70449.1 hypothetical protein B2904_orf1110 [Brachyspira pilosicoli B2904]AGA66115.1 hypothetical protein BPP43_04135 [Brachyspira pilosicoli P43/6/78]PLV61789.1 hypothetical protein BPSP16_05700 [Brachyspira pilosicoli SP16]WIH81663.1 hypothetical protein NEI04_01500 [Brachyspira pilosicoli]